MQEPSMAAKLRKAFEDLFQSRLVTQLEKDLLYLRSDSDRMRQEYQGMIADLRSEKAQLEARILMYDTRLGLKVPSETRSKPTFDFSAMPPVKTRWQVVVEEHEKQMARELEAEEKQRLDKEQGVATAA